MKKLLSAVLALTMILALATACGNTAVPDPDPEPESSSESESPPAAAPDAVEGVVKETSLNKIIITLANGTNLALDTSGISDLEVQIGDTVRAEYTGAVGAMTASKVEVTAKAEKEVITVSGVVTKVDEEYVFLTLEDGTEAALRTVSMEEGEVEEGDTLTIHYTDGGGTILSVDVTKAEKETEGHNAASSQSVSSQAAQGTPAGNTGTTSGSGAASSQTAQGEGKTMTAVVVKFDGDFFWAKRDDGREVSFNRKIFEDQVGRAFRIGDVVTIRYVDYVENGNAKMAIYMDVIGFDPTAASGDDDDEDDYAPSSKSSSGGSSESQAQVEPELPEDAGDVYEAIRLINAERKNADLSALDIDSVIMDMTALRAKELATRFEHTRPDGGTFYSVFDDFDWEYLTCAENIYAGKISAADAVDWWMHSPGHKANILKDNVTKIAVGYYYDSNSEWKHYWVMLVAAPR